MIKTLAQSVREYKKPAILTPIFVSLEVIMECIIPFLIATLVNEIKAGCGLDVIFRYGVVLIFMAILSLLFGAMAGTACAIASSGLARNLRQDLFHSIQSFSFENIDKFLVSVACHSLDNRCYQCTECIHDDYPQRNPRAVDGGDCFYDGNCHRRKAGVDISCGYADFAGRTAYDCIQSNAAV